MIGGIFLSELERLYELAFKFRETKLWQKMIEESQTIALDIEGHDRVFVNLLYEAQEFAEIKIFPTEEAMVRFFTDIIESQMNENDSLERAGSFINSEYIAVEYNNKANCVPEVVATVQEYKKRKNVKIHGSLGFPAFEEKKRNRVGLELQEENFATVELVLETMIHLAEYFAGESIISWEDLRFENDSNPVFTPPCFSYKDGKLENVGTLEINSSPKIYPSAKRFNDIAIKKIKSQKKKGSIQVTIGYDTTPSALDDGTLAFYNLLTVVDGETGVAYGCEPILDFHLHTHETMLKFTDILLRNKLHPKEIYVKNQQTFFFLLNFAKKLLCYIECDPDQTAFLNEFEQGYVEHKLAEGLLDLSDYYEDPLDYFADDLVQTIESIEEEELVLFKEMLEISDLLFSHLSNATYDWLIDVCKSDAVPLEMRRKMTRRLKNIIIGD